MLNSRKYEKNNRKRKYLIFIKTTYTLIEYILINTFIYDFN